MTGDAKSGAEFLKREEEGGRRAEFEQDNGVLAGHRPGHISAACNPRVTPFQTMVMCGALNRFLARRTHGAPAEISFWGDSHFFRESQGLCGSPFNGLHGPRNS